MFWFGVLPCMAAVIAVAVLTQKGMIPYDIGTPIWIGGMFATILLYLLDNRLSRRRQFSHYREAGFVVEPKDGSHINAFVPFPSVLTSGRNYTDASYWLPEAPELRVYDIVNAGNVLGHVITKPTSAPQGLVARELPADQIMREVQIPGAWPQLSTGADGVIRCSSNNCEMLVGALPLQRGVLVVMPSPWCTAHWRAYGSLTVDEIRSAIKALQRLPPPSESTDEIAAGAGY